MVIERMHPIAIIKNEPEGIDVQRAQIGNDRHEQFLHAFVMKRTRKVMVVDHVVATPGSQYNGNHMSSEVLCVLLSSP